MTPRRPAAPRAMARARSVARPQLDARWLALAAAASAILAVLAGLR